jgi:molybdenum cofactor guanylyltransferase
MNDSKAPNATFGTLILAGGRSSRMGTDKASLPYRGQTLLDHMRGLARQVGAVTILVGGSSRADLKDHIAGAGPVASLCALVDAAKGPERWLVLPVDMPLLGPDLLRRLVAGAAAVYFAGHPLPLALTMDSRARSVLERAKNRLLDGQSVAVHEVLAQLEADALPPSAGERKQLVNANTPEEWEELAEHARGE